MAINFMAIKPVKKANYLFHGVSISAYGDPDLMAALHSRLRHFPMTGQNRCDLIFEFCFVPAPANHVIEKPLGRARTVYESPPGKVLYVEEDDHLYISYGDGIRALCMPAQGLTRVSIVGPEGDNLWLATHPLFTLPLVELLKRREIYGLHAAGLSIDGKGVLLPGTSGAGKSTLTIALLRKGLDFLTDDTIFLAPGREGPRMLAFPDEIDVTYETCRMFPELSFLTDLPKRAGSRKWQVHAEEVYGSNTSWECRPSVIVFPRVGDLGKSVLRPMSSGEALLELAPNILLTGSISTQAHFDVLAELVRKTECYSLETGRDFDALPALIRDLVR